MISVGCVRALWEYEAHHVMTQWHDSMAKGKVGGGAENFGSHRFKWKQPQFQQERARSSTTFYCYYMQYFTHKVFTMAFHTGYSSDLNLQLSYK